MRLLCWIASGTVGFVWLAATWQVSPAQAVGDYLSDTPWRTGFVYSVYDPVYGRLLSEVRRNENGRGHPLTIDGKKHVKGFGCRLYSIIEVDVPAGAPAVSAVVGIDDEKAGTSGDTYFALWADGKCLWRSPALSRDDPAVAVTVPLGAAKQIKLITDAQGYENYDLADWCEVRWLGAGSLQSSTAAWHFLPQPGAFHVRPELHPFHLAHRGEDLPVTVVATSVAKVELTYAVLDEEGNTAVKGRVTASLASRLTGEASTVFKIPLTKANNGIYLLKLSVASGGKTVAERSVKFGLLDSRVGKPSQGSVYGVNHHEFVASYEPLAAAGIEWSRQWFCWAWIEPKKGEWHWNWHDERIAAAKEFGIKTIGVLGGIGQPAWMSPGHVAEGQRTTHGCPADMSDWEEYVRQVATRYRGQVRVWESWNEISGAADHNLNGWSVPKYVDLHRRTYRILKDLDPQNKVLVCADSLKFVDRCLEDGLGDAFDGIVIHPYRPGASPEAGCANYAVGNTGDVLSVFEASKAWLAERKRPQAEVWATEIGWALSGDGWPLISVETHGQYLPRTFVLSQASGQAANVCWHDFALSMFGICDGQGFPRLALLSFAGLTSRLNGAVPVKRHELGGRLHGFSFRRGDRNVLALWSETGVEFAVLKAAAALRANLFDFYGNVQPYDLVKEGKAVPVTGRLLYVESPSPRQVSVSRAEPIQLTPQVSEVVSGHDTRVTVNVENLFGEQTEVVVKADMPEGLSTTSTEKKLTVPWRERRSVVVALTAARSAAPGERAVPFVVFLPGGLRAPFQAYVRILPPLTLGVDPFDSRAPSTKPATVSVRLRNNDDRPLSGELTLTAPNGFAITPASATFAETAPGGTATMRFDLSAARAPTSADNLVLRASTTDGARVEISRALAPTVLDSDSNGLADGWRINPENTGKGEQRNIAEVAIEPGHAEFFCQKIHCPRFTSGWIILHRDNQDRIVKGKRYRITFWARQRDIEGTVGVAVYNITPWECCGIESSFKVGVDWQRITTEFTATRDSVNTRFEFFFTETGTVWIEGMRLEEITTK